MPDDRDPEDFTQAEIEQQAVEEPEDPHTRREELELDRMEATADQERGATADQERGATVDQ